MKFLKFYADWCGPCKVLETNLIRAGIRDYEAINVDENEELSAQYGIRNIPVFVAVSEGGTELGRFVGVKSPDGIKKWIEELNG